MTKYSGIYTGAAPQVLANGRPIITGDTVTIDDSGEDAHLLVQLAHPEPVKPSKPPKSAKNEESTS